MMRQVGGGELNSTGFLFVLFLYYKWEGCSYLVLFYFSFFSQLDHGIATTTM